MTHEQPPNEPKEREPSGESQPRKMPQIWVGSLADYNNGDLHGEWLGADRDPDEIHADIQAILASGPAASRGEAAEEWGIFDYDGFGSLRLGEYESIEDVARLAAGIAEHGPAFAAWAEAIGPDQATGEDFNEAIADASTRRPTTPSSWLMTLRAKTCSRKPCRSGCSHTSRLILKRWAATSSLVATSSQRQLKTAAFTSITPPDAESVSNFPLPMWN